MIVDTHLLISQILYNGLSNQMDFKLNRLAFAYGNIKPDFSNKDINRSHTSYESLHSVNKYSEELTNIKLNEATQKLEKAILAAETAETNKARLDASIELKKATARLEAVNYF